MLIVGLGDEKEDAERTAETEMGGILEVQVILKGHNLADLLGIYWIYEPLKSTRTQRVS